MRAHTVSLALMATTATASAVPSWLNPASQQQAALVEGGDKVPGENPLTVCPAPYDASKDIIEILKVDLLPNPPVPGQPLIIHAEGIVKETIVKGAIAEVEVRYGPIRLLKQPIDLCEQTAKADLECPIKEGKLTIRESVDIPNEVPSGIYHVTAHVTNGDKSKSQIACLEAAVLMTRSYSEL